MGQAVPSGIEIKAGYRPTRRLILFVIEYELIEILMNVRATGAKPPFDGATGATRHGTACCTQMQGLAPIVPQADDCAKPPTRARSSGSPADPTCPGPTKADPRKPVGSVMLTTD